MSRRPSKLERLSTAYRVNARKSITTEEKWSPKPSSKEASLEHLASPTHGSVPNSAGSRSKRDELGSGSKKKKVPDPVILAANQSIDAVDFSDGKPRAIIRSASKRRTNKMETSPPPSELNVPTLWIKGNDGIVHILETPAIAEGPTDISVFKPTKRKAKKGQHFDLAVEKPKGKKPDSPENILTALIDDEIFSSIQGVKITCEVDTEITQMKEEEVQQTLLQQQLQVQKEQVARTAAVSKKYEEKKVERKKPAIIKRRPIFKTKGKGQQQNTEYLYHIPHPNLMCPLFDLPPLGQILYGPYEKDVEIVEAAVWQKVLYRGTENIIFAES